MIVSMTKGISPDPWDILGHYAAGEIPCYVNAEQTEVGWVRYSHRGIQRLDRVEFPKSQRRYIFSPKFQVRFNTDFQATLAGCADLAREGRTWICPELLEGYVRLHHLGYAHSFEAWQDGVLVGGAFGIQIGGYITCESMFHRVSNASKAVWGQTLMRLKERGFEWIDTNRVADHKVEYGEEWAPHWQFEQMMREAMGRRNTLSDETPWRGLPVKIRAKLHARRLLGSLARRLKLRKAEPAPMTSGNATPA